MAGKPSLPSFPVRLWKFTRRVLKDFNHNQGILLAGSVAYNTLLSMIPLFAILVGVLSFFFDRERVFAILTPELERLVPGQSEVLAQELEGLLQQGQVIGVLGVLLLLLFSSLAFRMLEGSMKVIFHKTPKKTKKRGFWVSVGIHYAYVGLAGLTLVIVIGMSALLGTDRSEDVMLYLSGMLVQVVLFSSVYMVLPNARVEARRAIYGGITCAVLWEATRYFLQYYFSNISLAGVIYGSFATVIIVLVSMEIACIIVLLGAQVIAELERTDSEGLKWWEAEPLDEEDDPFAE